MSSSQPKKSSLFTLYKIKWACDIHQAQDTKRNFQVISAISNWLFELVTHNTDDIGMVERDWQIFHVSPGCIFVYLHLCAEDLQQRIQYLFKAPARGWSNRPLPSAEWTEHPYAEYWDFCADRQRMQMRPSLISQARMHFSGCSSERQETARDRRTVFSL